MTWTPDAWRAYPIEQQPRYADSEAFDNALVQLRTMPPLVAPGEVDALRAHFARAARGEAFVLQGGDCAERFLDCGRAPIERKLKILLQMSLVLTWGGRMPIIRVARMAGQYAKPRSRDTEVVDGVEIPSYRGDHVNGITPTPESRRHDPKRLMDAYFHSAATLNYVRALIDGGFADLHHTEHWDLGFVRSAQHRALYQEVIERILDTLDFMEATGIKDSPVLKTVELFSSHEGLLLASEEAQTARVGDDWYNLGAHMLWIGDRTRQLNGAHVNYFSGIANPIGVKVGPTMTPDDLLRLLDALEPTNRAGRVTLISRMGSDAVRKHLPRLVEATRREEREVIWSCDPMHGNTTTTSTGRKTRSVDSILDELRETFQIHDDCRSTLGGVHFELTGDDVTECIGGPQQLSESDLERSYETWCDPRLNYAQSLELAFLMAQRLAQYRS